MLSVYNNGGFFCAKVGKIGFRVTVRNNVRVRVSCRCQSQRSERRRYCSVKPVTTFNSQYCYTLTAFRSDFKTVLFSKVHVSIRRFV